MTKSALEMENGIILSKYVEYSLIKPVENSSTKLLQSATIFYFNIGLEISVSA